MIHFLKWKTNFSITCSPLTCNSTSVIYKVLKKMGLYLGSFLCGNDCLHHSKIPVSRLPMVYGMS